MVRTQFTFYESFAKALDRIRPKSVRADAYDAIVRYALRGEEPDLDHMPNAAAIAFELIRPNLDASRKKAVSGRLGGQANGKQTESKNENEDEDEEEIKNNHNNKKNNEFDIENDMEQKYRAAFNALQAVQRRRST